MYIVNVYSPHTTAKTGPYMRRFASLARARRFARVAGFALLADPLAYVEILRVEG